MLIPAMPSLGNKVISRYLGFTFQTDSFHFGGPRKCSFAHVRRCYAHCQQIGKWPPFFFRPLAELLRTIFRRDELILMGKSSSTGVWGQSPHEGKGEHATLINGPINWRLTSKFQSHRGLT